MKSMYLQPKEGEFFFEEADRFVEFGEANGMHMVGHTLIWHSQAPDWFFTDEEGNDVSRDVLIERMRNHITTVVVVIKSYTWLGCGERSDPGRRDIPHQQVLFHHRGRIYPLAFEFAHEADPDTELYYNDYGMGLEGRRNGVVSMVKSLQEKISPSTVSECRDTWAWVIPTSTNTRKASRPILNSA
jgi:endo-1,4-beta-xylanase